MATTLPSSFSSSIPPPPPGYNHSSPSKHDLCGLSLPFPFLTPPSTSLCAAISSNPRKYRPITLTLASSSSSHSASFSSFDDLGSDTTPPLVGDKKSLLADLIQEIEPLDVSLIQKDVPPMTLDAIKRTISGMLGLLPSDRFQVFIEALWEPLSKLLVSSMMTGYTLRNAEYRLFLERNFDIHEGDPRKQTPDDINLDLLGIASDAAESSADFGENAKSEFYNEDSSNDSIKGLGEFSSQAQQYILHLQSQLSSLKKELHEVKRKGAALQMQQFVGEEKNDLLDYLRSLQPEKVAELSEPTSPELKETIHSVVHGLLATLSPKMHSKAPSQSENPSAGTINIGIEDCAELVENTSLQFQPLISLTRDYVARLLFWCMLLGHYLRGLEYRMELMELLSMSSDVKNE